MGCKKINKLYWIGGSAEPKTFPWTNSGKEESQQFSWFFFDTSERCIEIFDEDFEDYCPLRAEYCDSKRLSELQNLPSGLEISRKKQWDDHKTTMAGVLGWPCECTIRYYPPKMEPENRHFLATWQGPTVGRMVTGCDWVTGMVQSIGKFVGPLMLLYVPSTV